MSWLEKLKNNKNLVFWWILVWAQIAGLFVAYKAGVINMIWTEDITKLTCIIFLVHILTSTKIGLDILYKHKKWTNVYWFISEQTFAVGIACTIIGFIILLHEGFASGVPTTPEAIKKMLTIVSSGMSVAFWGTLVAITCSIIQKVQAMVLELVE